MPAGHPRFSKQEIASRGKKAIYEQKLRSELEAGNLHKFLIIDVLTGDCEGLTLLHLIGLTESIRSIWHCIVARSSGTIGASSAGNVT